MFLFVFERVRETERERETERKKNFRWHQLLITKDRFLKQKRENKIFAEMKKKIKEKFKVDKKFFNS